MPYDAAVAAFFESLQHVGIFDKILADGAFRRVPIKGRGVVVTGSATGNKINEGMVKPVSSLDTGRRDIGTEKSAGRSCCDPGTCCKLGAPGTSELFNSELRTAVAAATDAEFLSTLVRGHDANRIGRHNDRCRSGRPGRIARGDPERRTGEILLCDRYTNAKRLAVKSGNGVPAFPKFGSTAARLSPALWGS